MVSQHYGESVVSCTESEVVVQDMWYCLELEWTVDMSHVIKVYSEEARVGRTLQRLYNELLQSRVCDWLVHNELDPADAAMGWFPEGNDGFQCLPDCVDGGEEEGWEALLREQSPPEAGKAAGANAGPWGPGGIA